MTGAAPCDVKRTLSYDPETRITTTFDYTPDGVTIIGRHQDIGPLLEQNKRMAADKQITRDGIKRGWWHYFTLPNIIAEKFMNEHGVSIYNKDHWPAIYKLVNRPEYRYLKTTAKMHRPKN